MVVTRAEAKAVHLVVQKAGEKDKQRAAYLAAPKGLKLAVDLAD